MASPSPSPAHAGAASRLGERFASQLAKEQEMREQLAKELADAQIQLTHSEGNLRVEKAFTVKLRAECEALLADMQTLTDEKTEVLRARAGDADELRALREAVAEKGALFEMAREQNEKLVALIGDLNVKSLAAKDAHLAKEKALETELHEYYALVKRRDAQVAELEAQLASARADAQAAASEASKVAFLGNKATRAAESASAATARVSELEAELSALKRQLAPLSRERDSARKAAAAAERESERARAEAAALEAKVVAMRDQDAASASLRQQVLDEAASARAQYDDALASYVLEIEKLHQDIPALRAERDILAAKLAEYEAELAREVTDRLALHEERLALLDRARTQAAALDEAQATARKALTLADSLGAQLATAKDSVSSLTLQRARLEHELEDEACARKTEESHCADIRLQKDQALARLQTTFHEYTVAIDAQAALERQVAALRRELALKSADDSTRAEQMVTLNVSVEESQTVMLQMHELKAALERDVDTLSSQLAVAETERKEADATVNQLRDELARVRAALDAQNATASESHSTVALLEHQLVEERQARERYAAKLAASQDEYRALLAEHGALQKTKIAVEDKAAALQRQLRAADVAAGSNAESTATTAMASQRLNDRIAHLESELAERDAVIETLQSEVDALNAENEHANLTNKSIELELELSKASVSVDKVEASKSELKADWTVERTMLETRLRDAERVAERMRTELAAEQKALADVVAAATARADEEKKEVVQCKRQVREAIMESESVRAELAHVQTRYESERGRLATEHERREAAEAELERTKRALADATVRIELLQKAQADLTFAQGLNSELRRKVTALEGGGSPAASPIRPPTMATPTRG